jgi:hypothetical protein
VEGKAALQKLGEAVAGLEHEIYVVPAGVISSRHLPGGIILLAQKLITDQNRSDAASGAILTESLKAETNDPMKAILRYAGLSATFQLLTTGDLPTNALSGYGEEFLTHPDVTVDTATLLKRFAEKGLPASPYAYALDPSGESTLGLIEGDPFRGMPTPQPLLDDNGWVALQGICGN